MCTGVVNHCEVTAINSTMPHEAAQAERFCASRRCELPPRFARDSASVRFHDGNGQRAVEKCNGGKEDLGEAPDREIRSGMPGAA